MAVVRDASHSCAGDGGTHLTLDSEMTRGGQEPEGYNTATSMRRRCWVGRARIVSRWQTRARSCGVLLTATMRVRGDVDVDGKARVIFVLRTMTSVGITGVVDGRTTVML